MGEMRHLRDVLRPPLDRLDAWLHRPGAAYQRWLGRVPVCAAWLGLALAVFSPHTGGVTCWVKSLSGVPCPGCGMTRSLSSGLRGMFGQSWHYHPMGLLILLLFVLIAVLSLLSARRKRQLARSMESRAVLFNSLYLAFVVAFLGFGVVRILTHLPALVLHKP
jgi:hypothetical protein